MSRRNRQTPPPSSKRSHDWSVVFAAAAALLQILMIWLPGVPLGIPNEWTWDRIPYGPAEFAQLLLNAFFVVPAAAGYCWLCRAGDSRLEHHRSAPRLWLAGLVIAGFGWLWTVQTAVPDDLHSLGRAPIVLNFPAFSGYFTEARSTESMSDYLRDYESLMAEGDVLHIGTHPPGLIIGHYCLLKVFHNSPALTELALATRPASVRLTEEMIAGLPALKGPPTSKADLAELWVAALLIQFAAAATVLPLYQLTRHVCGAAAAWRTACLWPLVPALGVFLPKSDAILPLIGLTTLALWWPEKEGRPIRAAAAGVVFWIGMMISLAMLPVGFLAGLLSAHSLITSDRTNRATVWKRILTHAAIAVAAFAALTITVWLIFDLNLLRVWSWNYRNHSAFYDAYDRTYWKWLLVNPFELAMAIGLPVVATAIVFRREIPISAASTLPILVVVILLWLSGKNSGEAARLWLFLIAWLLWLIGSVWQGISGRLRWRRILILQLIVSVAVVTRVSGFGFFQIAGMAD